jgi:hypothetical protein
LTSTTREIKASEKQCQWAFAEIQKQMEDKLKEVAKETEHAIISLAKSVTEDNKPENLEGNAN